MMRRLLLKLNKRPLGLHLQPHHVELGQAILKRMALQIPFSHLSYELLP